MTEAEWLASASPMAMLRHLHCGGCTRKELLYAIAVFRLRPELLTPVLSAWADTAERFASGEATYHELVEANLDADEEANDLSERGPLGTRAQYAAISDVVVYTWEGEATEYGFVNEVPPEELESVRRANAHLVRDIFGNPFRPVTFLPEWRTSTVLALAQQMYDSRDFSAMPILADAIQDAECVDEAILAHCRGPGTHVLGCHLVDAILNKA